jgi:hypothetical protein
VLTARHCIETLPGNAKLAVYLPREGLRNVKASVEDQSCAEPACTYPNNGDDLVGLRLQRPYRHIVAAQPASVNHRSSEQAFAEGFGDSNLILSDRGLLLRGPVKLGSCVCGSDPQKTTKHLCFSVTPEPGTFHKGYFVNFPGHSGGPLYQLSGTHYELLGIASSLGHGCDSNGAYEGRYVDITIPEHEAWLTGAFPDTLCPADDTVRFQLLLEVAVAHLEAASTRQHRVQLEAGTTELLVNLNHETASFRPEPKADLSIVLPRSLAGECSRYYGVESCHVSNPPPGAYSIGIQRESGNPAYQLTVVAIYEE